MREKKNVAILFTAQKQKAGNDKGASSPAFERPTFKG